MKTTIIKAKEAEGHRNRKGFVPICEYGPGMQIFTGEIGGICRPLRGACWTFEDGVFILKARMVERIVVEGA